MYVLYLQNITIWAASWQNQQNGMCTQRRLRSALGICPVWSESSLSAWRKLGSLATHSAHSEDSDLTGWMPSPIWIFAGRTVILLVLSRGSSITVDDSYLQMSAGNSIKLLKLYLNRRKIPTYVEDGLNSDCRIKYRTLKWCSHVRTQKRKQRSCNKCYEGRANLLSEPMGFEGKNENKSTH